MLAVETIRQYVRDLVIRKKILFLLLALTLSLSAVISVTLYTLARANLDRALQRSLRHSAITASLLIDGDSLDRIHGKADQDGPEWTAVMRSLTRVREGNGLESVYVLRGTSPGRGEFLADSSRSRTAAVGQEYDIGRVPAMEQAFTEASADEDITTDEFGSTLSGYAPIRRKDGSTAAIIGLDLDGSDVVRGRHHFKLLAAGIAVAFLFISFAASVAFSRVLTGPIVDMSERAQELSAGKLETRMLVRGRDEIGQLSHAVNRMLDTLTRYLPMKLVSQILGSSSDLKLGGSVVAVTAFFSDIAGFTTIAEKLTPEQTVALLNEYLSTMTDIIEDSGGTVDKYVGDAVVAFWGAPVKVADHAVQACEAALRQREALARLQEKWRAEGKPEIRIRIGLNTGEVLVGNMGSSRRFSYTIMGDSVNLASRLEGANKIYGTGIMLGETTWQSVKGSFECRRLDRVKVVGKSIAVSVYELLGRKGQVAPAVLESRDRFEKALEAFSARRWDEAEALFGGIANDPAAVLYKHRIEELRASPPPREWAGEYALTAK
jgi:class 3 adenylate cyclase